MIPSLKIIDASTVLAGPSVGMFFAELGAQVLKIENPAHPDVTRSWKLASEDPESTVSAYFASVNYGKTYLGLDLKDPQDRAVFLEHLRDADILLTNFKKGDAAKFNLGEEVLKTVNPKLIHGQISGFGKDSDRVAYDLILQAESGFMSINGTSESGPVKMPVALIDVLAAHQLKEGVLVALLERERSGLGKTVHVSLYDAAVCSLINQASSYLMTGNVPERIGSLHPTIAPYGEIFTTHDQAQITFAIGSDTQFMKTCHFLGLELLPDDLQFQSNQQRVIHRSALFAIFQEQIRQMNSAVILSWMEEHFVPCGKIRNLSEVFEDVQAQSFIRSEEIALQKTRRMSSIAFQSW
jgi:crotonobetainyl-CoA:carnitine CoA-transferase CaiB-like acyl-CoA transferase